MDETGGGGLPYNMDETGGGGGLPYNMDETGEVLN